jgi:serine phosphatase RsbU (regulator of sigma subunit)
MRFFGLSQASREVGGDYFDVIPIEGKGVLLAIADVMGKGMPAALLATILRTTIRARPDLATTPDLLLTEVNRQMQADLTRLDMFITAQVIFVADDCRQLVFASAAHCPILKYSPQHGLVEQILDGSVPLGVLPGTVYSPFCVEVLPGQRFVFLTDGIFEAEGRDGKMLGMEEVARQVQALSAQSPASFCVSLLLFVRNYSRPGWPSDDRTVLVMDAL